MVRPVAIYSDIGTSEVGVISLLTAVEQHLERKTLLIKAQDILYGCLMECVALIVLEVQIYLIASC